MREVRAATLHHGDAGSGVSVLPTLYHPSPA